MSAGEVLGFMSAFGAGLLAILGPTLLAAVAVTVVAGADGGLAFRCAAILALLAWVAVTLRGTVPINEGALDWDPAAPPG